MTIPDVLVSKHNPILSAKWLKYVYFQRPLAALPVLFSQLIEQRD